MYCSRGWRHEIIVLYIEFGGFEEQTNIYMYFRGSVRQLGPAYSPPPATQSVRLPYRVLYSDAAELAPHEIITGFT